MNPYEVIRRPIITEKSIAAAKNNRYTFVVRKDASKRDILRAVEQLFSVTVKKVRIANYEGKTVRVGRRRWPQKRSSWKKAVVTVKEGEKIDLFDLG